MAKPLSYYMTDEVEKELNIRGKKLSPIITRDLLRLYTAYRTALLEIPLTLPETCMVVEAIKNVPITADNGLLLHTIVLESMQKNNLAGLFDVDIRQLIGKLRNLNIIQSLAIVDAAERVQEMAGDMDITTAIKAIFHLR